jgi:hypothetical protein
VLDLTLEAICDSSKSKMKMADVVVNNQALLGYSAVGVEAQPGQAEVDKVLKQEPLDNTTPDPLINGLLTTYALVHLYSSVTGFQLLQSSTSGEQSLFTAEHLSCVITLSCAYRALASDCRLQAGTNQAD